ncbi:MAG: TldD/PmbA family protein [Deltaproteobacteria bacterium]|nr:TldD/PmbA family protein [Deltaproteobacteria bacterium]
MLPEATVHDILTLGKSRGADFVEVYAEESHAATLELTDRKIDTVNSGVSFGVGVRLIFGDEAYYSYSSDPERDTLLALTDNMAASRATGAAPGTISPFRVETLQNRHPVREFPGGVSKEERVILLRRLDELTRNQGEGVRQVSGRLSEKERKIFIANSEGLWVEDSRQYARVALAAIAEKGDGPQVASESPGALGGYEFFRELDLDRLAEDTAASALRMADAGYIQGGVMPVVLGSGFGGVIFHEACGHPLETESVRKKASPFAGKLGQPVAQSILTAIDDGTLVNHWGSLNIDDEGMPAMRTVLIENGILKNYLSDRIGAAQVGVPRTGSGRRESYKYAPASRMRNTYIAPGPHTMEDMIASIDSGLYARKMGGGSVDPATGEFNFAVQEGYAIRKGKIAEPVRGATLIGKGFEVLPLISMIGSDLHLSAGMCGSVSGLVPTTVGQPSLKIDRILVGGR